VFCVYYAAQSGNPDSQLLPSLSMCSVCCVSVFRERKEKIR
jgi:hypothetical protein